MDNGGLSTILLDKHHLTVGETVTLFCHGLTTSATDWIGLFYTGNFRSVCIFRIKFIIIELCSRNVADFRTSVLINC